MAKFPLGKVPAFESSTGVCLNESNAIAMYVANEQLTGKSAEDKARVVQWMNFADQEITPAVCTWVFPCMGFMQFNKTNSEKAKEEILAVMKTLNDTLATKTFLVGERITLADLGVATNLLLAYQWVMEPAFRSPFPNVNRWFETVVNQPEVKKALPKDFKMCEKMAQFDAKKYAEMSGGDKKKTDKKDKKEKKPAAKKDAPKKKEEKAEADPADPPKEKKKDAFLEFPAPEKWNWDEWKKTYSNEDVDTVTMPWFWQNWEPTKMSAWYGVYTEDLSGGQDFMNVNLIGGMLQRLDGLRKHGFGVNIYFNAPTRKMSAVYICRGPKLPFSVSDDLNVDAPSYDWRQLDLTKDSDKLTLTEHFSCEGKYDGFEYYDAKVFK